MHCKPLQFKNYSLEKKKQNTGFVWNAASASDFRQNKEVDLCLNF